MEADDVSRGTVVTRWLRAYLERGESRGPDDPLRFVAANEGKMGDGLDLAMDGLNLDRFNANPVVFWAHQHHTPPIGRVTGTEVDGTRLLADVVFDTDDDLGREVDRKYRGGFLNAVSIGFDFEPDAVGDDGRVSAWEMHELSAVPLPMDPGALVESGRVAMRALGHELLELADDDPADDGTTDATSDDNDDDRDFETLTERLVAAGFVRVDPADREAQALTRLRDELAAITMEEQSA